MAVQLGATKALCLVVVVFFPCLWGLPKKEKEKKRREKIKKIKTRKKRKERKKNKKLIFLLKKVDLLYKTYFIFK